MGIAKNKRRILAATIVWVGALSVVRSAGENFCMPIVQSPNQVPSSEFARGVESQNSQQVSLSQSLADIGEEMTFAFSERVGRDLSRRRVSDGQQRLSEVQEMLEEYLRRVPDLERQHRLEALIAQLGSGALHNLEQLTAYLQSFSSEVSHQFVALACARRELAQKAGTEALLVLIDQALLKMSDQHGEAIELGLRIGPLAQEAEAQGVGDIQALRETYRDAIQDYKGLRAAWEDVIQRFGNVGLEGVAAFMLKALSADLDSQRTPRDSVRLELIIGDMRKLRELKSLYLQVQEFWSATITREEGHGIRAF